MGVGCADMPSGIKARSPSLSMFLPCFCNFILIYKSVWSLNCSGAILHWKHKADHKWLLTLFIFLMSKSNFPPTHRLRGTVNRNFDSCRCWRLKDNWMTISCIVSPQHCRGALDINIFETLPATYYILQFSCRMVNCWWDLWAEKKRKREKTCTICDDMTCGIFNSIK